MLKSAISMMAVHILLVFCVALALGSTVGDLLYPDMEQPIVSPATLVRWRFHTEPIPVKSYWHSH